MPNIELEPHEYSRRDPRTGKMVRDFSPKWARNWFLVALAGLGWVVWNRDGFATDMLVALAIFWAFWAGVMAANWLKNIY